MTYINYDRMNPGQVLSNDELLEMYEFFKKNKNRQYQQVSPILGPRPDFPPKIGISDMRDILPDSFEFPSELPDSVELSSVYVDKELPHPDDYFRNIPISEINKLNSDDILPDEVNVLKYKIRKALLSNRTDNPYAHLFSVGDAVYKKEGYEFIGNVVSAFNKLDGQTRYVVENTEGMLHIMNENQLSRLTYNHASNLIEDAKNKQNRK